jgi:hypothetical protein
MDEYNYKNYYNNSRKYNQNNNFNYNNNNYYTPLKRSESQNYSNKIK